MMRRLRRWWGAWRLWWAGLWFRPGLVAPGQARVLAEPQAPAAVLPDTRDGPSPTLARRVQEEHMRLATVQPNATKQARREIGDQFSAAFGRPMTGRQWTKVRKEVRRRHLEALRAHRGPAPKDSPHDGPAPTA